MADNNSWKNIKNLLKDKQQNDSKFIYNIFGPRFSGGVL